MYKNKTVIQIGSHIGNTQNDPIFTQVDESTRLILIEPVPYLFELLKNNYRKKLKKLSNVTFINNAVSDSGKIIDLYIPSYRNDFSKLPFWASQLASTNRDHLTTHIPSLIVDAIQVHSVTIDEIIRQFDIKELELLHTDTEGHDFTILMGYSFVIKPKKILFESKHMDGVHKRGKNYRELSAKLVSLGYKKTMQNTEDTMFELI